MLYGNKLKDNVLYLFDCTAQSCGFLSPIITIAFFSSFIASVAGYATPLIFLISGLTSMAVAYVIAQFAKKYQSAGGVYSYIYQSLGLTHGFLSGWIYLLGLVAAFLAILVAFGNYAETFLFDYLHVKVHWFLLMLIAMSFLVLISFFDVRVSTRIQLIIVAIAALLILAMCFYIISKGGAEGNSLLPFSPASSPSKLGLGFGLILGTFAFAGYESATVLSEEAKAPKKTIPNAIILSVGITTIFFVIVSYAYAIGFGNYQANHYWGNDSKTMATIAHQYLGNWAVPVTYLLVILDAFAVAVAILNTASRVLFSMGREKLFPQVLGKTQFTQETPFLASCCVLMLSFFITLIFWCITKTWEIEFNIMLAISSICFLITYLYIIITGLICFRKTISHYSKFKHLIIPLIAAISSFFALIASIVPRGGIQNYVPVFVIAWILIGFFILKFVILPRFYKK